MAAMYYGERDDEGGPSADAVVGGMLQAEEFAIARAWAMAMAQQGKSATKGRRRGRR